MTRIRIASIIIAGLLALEAGAASKCGGLPD
jgi:hypothetical protein